MKKVVLLSLILAVSACAGKNNNQQNNEPLNDQPTQVEQVSNKEQDTDKEYTIEDFNKFAKNNPLYFDFDSSKVVGKHLVKNYVNEIKKLDKNVKLTINGYCDERGSNQYNDKLGQERAEAVKLSLAERGLNIDDFNIELKSFGKRKFKKYYNDFEQNQQANRKVEVLAVSK